MEQYKELIEWNNITNDRSKCKYLQRYCSREVRELLETLIKDDTAWVQLKKKFEELFDSHQENVVKSESTAETGETHQMLADVSRL